MSTSQPGPLPAPPLPAARAGWVTLTAFLGWIVPLVAVVPISLGHEAAAGESALFAGFVWLVILGPLGCAVAGWLNARLGGDTGTRGEAFWFGIAVMATACVVLFAWDGATPYVSLGVVSLLGALPLMAGYAAGFGTRILWERAV